MTPPTTCRLCTATADYQFSQLVLGRYEVAYYRCNGCGSLLTEEPYWLDHAYGFSGARMDVGNALRPLQNWLLLTAAFAKAGLPREPLYIDFGANTGLFPRLMRYSGYNFSAYEKYVTPYLSDYDHIESLSGRKCAGITAFEVVEHFAHPAQEFDAMFQTGPDFIIVATELYSDQPPSWDYLAPYCGQHVYFYSERALRSLGQQYGYRLLLTRHYQVFLREAALASGSPLALLAEALTQADFTDADTLSVVNGVVRGNPFIEKDWSQAVSRFERELQAPPPAPDSEERRLLRSVAQMASELQELTLAGVRSRIELRALRESLAALQATLLVDSPKQWLGKRLQRWLTPGTPSS